MNIGLEHDSLLETNAVTDYGLVSIIMPNYNSERYLNETIKSVLWQTYQNWELLFVDDCSSDKSLEIIRSYKDDRIKVFKLETNSGAAAARNYALREAAGKWIAFLDSDDIWLPQKLEKQLHFMLENKYDITYTSYLRIDEGSNDLGIYVVGPRKVTRRKMYMYDYLGCLTVIYNSEKTGVLQVDERLKSRNDYAIWLKVSQYCICYFYDKPLSKYRIRTKSLSHNGLQQTIKNQYRLFRYGESMCVVKSLYHTGINIFFGALKKIWDEKSKKRYELNAGSFEDGE